MKLEIKRALLLAPHPDDGEFGCGGTLKKLTESGVEVYYICFSPCNKSLPDGYADNTLYEELKRAVVHLGIPPENVITFDFPVRDFPGYRQAILEDLVKLNRSLSPDLVLLPHSADIHQDHQTINREGIRAFKMSRILGYELPWNLTEGRINFHVKLEKGHIESKIAAIDEYKTQDFRSYKDPELFFGLAKSRGIQCKSEYAEGFEMIRFQW